jgi:hypothetical protein
MTQHSFTRTTRRLCARLIAVALLAASPYPAVAGQTRPSVTGTWQISVVHGHAIPFGLQLEQDGAKVKGTLAIPPMHGGAREALPLEGEILEGTFKLKTSESSDASGPARTTVAIAGRLLDDGTMEGTIEGKMGTMKWTAERLRGPGKR